jgi:hypothetical protein
MNFTKVTFFGGKFHFTTESQFWLFFLKKSEKQSKNDVIYFVDSNLFALKKEKEFNSNVVILKRKKWGN